jgi:hypothetical protein
MKKYAKWAGIAFVIWYIITQPTGAANVVHSLLGGLSGAATSLSQFVSQLP